MSEISDAKYDLFLRELALDGIVTRAAAVVAIDRGYLYQKRLNSPEFAERWAAAIEASIDRMEQEAVRRAVEGTTKGIWHQGARVGEEQQYSDALLMQLLKAKRKREFGDSSKVEMTGADGGPINHSIDLTVSFVRPARKDGSDLA